MPLIEVVVLKEILLLTEVSLPEGVLLLCRGEAEEELLMLAEAVR